MNYFLFCVVYFLAHTALVDLTDVSLNYAEHCDDAAQCYSKFMQCSSDGEEMVLKLTPLPLPKQKTPHPLFNSDKNSNLVILYLKFDTSEIVNSIKQTTQNGINPPKTDPITEKVMYYPNNHQRLNGLHFACFANWQLLQHICADPSSHCSLTSIMPLLQLVHAI